MGGFRLVVRLSLFPPALHGLIESRAKSGVPLLDPELAQINLRAGLGLMRNSGVEFVYAMPEDVVAVVKVGQATHPGDSLRVRDQLLSVFVSRLALLLGQEVSATARLYEFPDMEVVRRALTALQEAVEQNTPYRTSAWLGAQLRGKGMPFHPSMLETIEEQTSLLENHGVDMEALPPWWWRGVAARHRADGEVEIFQGPQPGEDFAALIGVAP